MLAVSLHVLRRLLVGAALALLATGEASADSMRQHTPWFRTGLETAEDWVVTVQAADADTVVVKSRQRLSSQPLRHITVLYPRPSSAYDTAISQMLEVLSDKKVDVEIVVTNFALSDARGQAALRAAERNNHDLVVAMGSEATAWLWQNYRNGRIPVVTVCSKDPVMLGQVKDYTSGSGTNFAFTSLNLPLDVQMQSVFMLRPGLKNLAILVDGNNLSAMQTQAVPLKQYAVARGIHVIDLVLKSTTNAKEQVGDLVHDAVQMMRRNDPDFKDSLFWITGSTAVFDQIQAINAHAYRVPVLSTVTDVVQAGDNSAVLSIGVSFESNAHVAALIAIDVLDKRRKAGDIPVGVVSPPDIAVNFRKAREIGLKIPFALFEGASIVYDNEGKLARSNGRDVTTGAGSETDPSKAPDNGAAKK